MNDRDPLPPLVAKLRALGFEEHVRALDRALYGSTSGEVYCSLCVALAGVVGDARLDPETSADAARLLAEYDAVVCQPNVEARGMTTADRLAVLIAAVRAAGHARDARTLQDAVSGGATSGEILDRSLVELTRLIARREVARGLRDEARAVIASIREDQHKAYGTPSNGE